MTPRKLVLAAVLASSLGCAKQVPARAVRASTPRAVQLLVKMPALETEQLEASRMDIEIDTRDFERTPRVVTTGETDLLLLGGKRARLYGNEAASEGFSVDNCILFEVLDARGRVINRGVVGSTEPVDIGPERVSHIGPQSFTFGPGAVDLTPLLPEKAPFMLRMTVLDYSGVGRVSDVFLVFEPRAPASGEDDLRGH
jgi:hypothetical protein